MVHDQPLQAEMAADPDGGRPKGSTDTRPPLRQACIECRRRKIKCSGFGKSGCKTCKTAGVDCVFPESQKRGPHKGYFETISTRLSRIEKMLQDAIEKQEIEKHEGSSEEDYGPERKRRKSKQHQRRVSQDRPLPPLVALLAPKSSTSPDIPFHAYRPRLSISAISSPPLSQPEESALGVLAQVAHEMEPASCAVTGDYFADANALPNDLAEGLVHLYFEKVHPFFPIVHKDTFMRSFRRSPDAPVLSDHLAWAMFLAGSSFSDDLRIHDGLHARIQIEKRLKVACEREFERGKSSDLSLIQSILLGQLFPAKRERKVALLSWTMNGRAVKLALKQQLNVHPQKLGHDPETCHARMLSWWCVYIVDVWDAAKRGRPPGIHEGEYDVPVPPLPDKPSQEDIFFSRLVSLTRILAGVLSFCFNNHQSSSTISSLDPIAEEKIRRLRRQLSDWYRADSFSRMARSLSQNLYVAYLTVVILLHRPLLPTPLATAFSDPIVLLVSKCASTIVQIAQVNGVADAGSVSWRLFVPAVGYLTAGITLAQNAAWSTHISGASALRLSAQRDSNKLIEVFDAAELRGHYTAGMSALLRDIFKLSGVDMVMSPDVIIPEMQGTPLPLPHEDPSFYVSQVRPSPEKTMSLPERRASGPAMQPLAPITTAAPPRAQSLTDPTIRKRKHSEISHFPAPSQKPLPQHLPSLANLTGLDPGRRSPTARSVHSLSTYSSHSSTSHNRHGSLYPRGPLQPPSTAYHPAYGAQIGETSASGGRHGRQQWDPKHPPSPPLPAPHDSRRPDAQPPYISSSRDFSHHHSQHQQSPYYSDRREDYYHRSKSPSRQFAPHEPYPRGPYSSSQQGESPYRRPLPPPQPPPIDTRYRHPTPPLSAAGSSTSPSWPPGYPYPVPHQRYEATSPRAIPVGSSQGRWTEYYNYPPQRS